MGRVRAALTQTVNAFRDMPRRVEALPSLRGRLGAVRSANLEHNIALIRAARARGAKIICLGELFAAPYFALEKNPMWRELAEDAARGPSVCALRETAALLGIIIIAPIYELDARTGKRYNTAVVINEKGRILGKYRKNHIPQGANEQGCFTETFYYGRGEGGKNSGFPVFPTSVGKIGISICYDRHFEGVVRALARAGAELIFSPAVTFGAKSRRLWDMEFLVDAARHRVFIGGSNRLGKEKPWNQAYYGASYFAGPDGEKLMNLSRDRRLVISDLDFGTLKRPDPSGWNLSRDARPEIY